MRSLRDHYEKAASISTVLPTYPQAYNHFLRYSQASQKLIVTCGYVDKTPTVISLNGILS